MSNEEKSRLANLIDKVQALAETAAFGNIGRKALVKEQKKIESELKDFALNAEGTSIQGLNWLERAAGINDDLLWSLHDLNASGDIYRRVKTLKQELNA